MEEKRKSGFATAGLVLGIIAICFSFIPIISYLSFILGILAIIFSIVALGKKASKGMAIAGLIISIIAVYMAYNMHKGLETAVDEVSSSLSGGSTQSVEKTEYNKGEEAIIGNTAITVTNVEKSQGSTYDKPKSGKEFVIVHLTIENKGNEKLSYNPLYFEMQNSQGQQESTTFTTVDQDTALQSGELISGGKISGTITFEQPKNDAKLVLIYKDSIWSSKELKINL